MNGELFLTLARYKATPRQYKTGAWPQACALRGAIALFAHVGIITWIGREMEGKAREEMQMSAKACWRPGVSRASSCQEALAGCC